MQTFKTIKNKSSWSYIIATYMKTCITKNLDKRIVPGLHAIYTFNVIKDSGNMLWPDSGL